MTETQMKIADAIIKYFKDKEGDYVSKNALYDLQDVSIGFTLNQIRYMTSILMHNRFITRDTGFIHNTEIFILTNKGWEYESYQKFEQEEKTKEEYQKYKEQLETQHIQTSVDTNKSVQDTNRNVRRSNRVIVAASISTALFALGAFVISLFSFLNTEKLSPKLSGLNTTLQMQSQRQQQLEISLREINQSIQTLRNENPISVRVVK